MEKEKKVEEVTETVKEGTNTPEVQPSEPKKEEKSEIKYSDENLAKIEELRKEFYKVYKSQNTGKWIFSIIAIGVLIFAFLGVPNLFPGDEFNALRISLMITLGVLSLLCMFGYSFIMRRVINKKLRKYFDDVYACLEKFIYVKEGLEVIPNDEKTLNKIQFDEAGIYKGVIQVNSRQLTKLKYHGKDIMIVDAAAQINDGKKMTPVFVGKYLVAPSKYEGQPILVYIKGDKRSIAPTNIDDLKLVFDDEKMSVFSNEPNWNKTLTLKFKKALLGIKLDNTLIDIALMLKDKKAYICMNYDDSLMILPLENPFNPHPNEEFKEDFEKMLDFIDLINE